MKLNLSAGFAIDVEAAAGEEPTRQISGIAVPYNVPATVSDGSKVQFAAGSLPVDGKAPKLFMYHDSTQPVGLVTARTETPLKPVRMPSPWPQPECLIQCPWA